MSHNNYSEYEPTDREIEDYLDEIYPEDVIVCGMPMSQSYALKKMDRIAFDMFASDNMNYYQCDECQEVYRTDDAENDAMECCQEYCGECGEPVESMGVCDCQVEEE